ncbi:MAG: 3-isopropylmalate dehydratase [Betaproteobacteria bacterium]|nr:3-isopropylmalate dehydratase [Betaproteobacteria bacterium]
MNPVAVSFSGRILFLAADPDIVARQLAGEDLTLTAAGKLRDGISTDEITPSRICVHADERLGDYVYLGLKCGDAFPCTEGRVKRAGFAVSVAGRRYGRGSSREQSPFAERAAGIRLVIAESFERIYRQNCMNLGIFTSSDFGLVERIRAGEAIPIEEFTRGHDPITAAIIRSGGLAAFTRERRRGGAPVPVPDHGPRAMTLAEKLIARSVVTDSGGDDVAIPQVGVRSVRPGDAVFVRAHWRYSHEYLTPMAATIFEQAFGEGTRVRDPGSVLAFQEHLAFPRWSAAQHDRGGALLDAAQALGTRQAEFCARHGIRAHGLLADRDGSEGICHSIVTERYAIPGHIVVGTDSHTPHAGALGCLAFGIGASDMASAWLTGDVRLTVPPTCRVVLRGRLGRGVAAKDLVLHLLRLPHVREGGAVGQVIEYCGDAVAAMNTDERATLTNMSAEIGGFTGIVAPDAETLRFLSERRGVDLQPEPWLVSDPDAEFAHTLDIDCGAVRPMVARPGDPGHGVEIDALADPVPIDVAYCGSCTGAKREDLDRVHEVLEWGIAHGLRVAENVRFYVQFGSLDVRDYCAARGMLETLREAGVEAVEPGCGACVNAGPGASSSPDEITVSAQNRNFPGRSGPGQVWLASPATVAASALAGRLTSFAALGQMPPSSPRRPQGSRRPFSGEL